jgi:hypothetical protein
MLDPQICVPEDDTDRTPRRTTVQHQSPQSVKPLKVVVKVATERKDLPDPSGMKVQAILYCLWLDFKLLVVLLWTQACLPWVHMKSVIVQNILLWN